MGRARRQWIIPGSILVVALATRVGYVLATPGYTMLHDDHAYDRLALGIARTGAYPDVGGHATAYRPPGFTYMLGAVYALAGSGHARVVAARMVQALVGVVIVALLGALAARLVGRRAAVCTMLLAALYVPLVAAGTSLLSEPLTVALELGAVLAVLAWQREGRLRWVMAAGATGGAMALCRSNGFVVIIALAVGVALAGRRVRPGALEPVAVLALTAAAIVAPWTVRNAVVLHAFIPVSDELGGTLAGTYNPVSAHDPAGPGFWRLLSQIPQYDSDTRTLAAGPEYPFQQKLVHLALQYAEHHPLYPLDVAWWNTKRLLGFNSLSLSRFTASVAGITSPEVADAGVFSFWVVGAMALVACFQRGIRRRIPAFVWLVAAFLFLSIVFVNSEAPRLRLPLDPFVLLLAGAGLASITGRAGRSCTGPSASRIGSGAGATRLASRDDGVEDSSI